MTKKSSVQMFTKAVALASALMFGNAALAADYYWDNDAAAGFGTAGGTWAAPTLNLWSLDPTGTDAPEASVTTGTSDALHFGTASAGLAEGTITVSGAVSANSLTYGSASGAITLSGGTSLTLGGTTPTITVNNTSNTISSAIKGTAGITKLGSGTLNFMGASLFGGDSPLMFTVDGGKLAFTQTGSTINTISGASAGVTINNASTVAFSKTGSEARFSLRGGAQVIFGATGGNTFDVGNITILLQSSVNNMTTYAGARNIIKGSQLNTQGNALNFNVARGTDESADLEVQANISATGSNMPLNKSGNGILALSHTANPLNAGSYITISAGTLALIGSGKLGSGSYIGNITNNASFLYASTADQALSGVISGTGTLTKTNTSTLTLSGNNTYSGATTISAGRVGINNAGALSPNTAVTVSDIGQLYFQPGATNNTYNNAMTLSGLGYVEGDNTQIGAIRLEDNVTLGGILTLPGDARVGIIGARSATLSGQVTGSGGLEFHGVKNANSTHHCTLTLSNTGNDYAGITTISSKDYSDVVRSNNTTTLKLGASGVIPDGAGKGIVALTGTSTNHLTLLDLNGFNETVNGLTNSAAEGARITNTGAETAILTVGAGDTTSIFSGVITEAGSGAVLALTKIGTGTLTLSATNSYTGTTSISGGVLRLTHAEALASATAVDISTTTGAKIDLDFSGANTVKSLTVNGKLLTRHTFYTSANLPSALSGGGALYTLEGHPPGTMVRFF